jgi:hypothetical protein
MARRYAVYNEGNIKHANLRLPKPTVHKGHPFRDQKNHNELLEYIKSRLAVDKDSIGTRRERMAQIDRDVAAWVQLSDEDKARAVDHARTGKGQATQVSLPLMWVHLDDMMTYYAQTFAPSRGMFYHTAKPDQKDGANALAMVMNSHAIYGSYYRHILRAIFAILKYNCGGVFNNWETELGPQVSSQADGSLGVEMKPIFNGNLIKAIDMYNFYYDRSVDPSVLHKDGEWCAEAEVKSHYWLKSKAVAGEFYNLEDMLDSTRDNYQPDVLSSYYVDPPSYSKIASDESNGTSWVSVLSGTDGQLVGAGFELVTCYIRINPNDFGLIPGTAAQKATRDRYEIWKVVICNGERIIKVEWQDNIHNHLPAYIGVIADDNMREKSKSPAEVLNPLQQFASFLMNVHVEGARKNLYGTTFYDPSRVDYSKIPKGEVAARVPIKPQAFGQDIRSMVYHDNNLMDTKQTMQDLEALFGIVNQFFPTQSLPSQIAGIDRAVDSQVAAVQQGSNRRQHKGARLIDDTMLRPMRYGMYYNIIQYISQNETIQDYFSNKSQDVDVQALRDMNLTDVIGQGLKAIDRQAVASQIQQVLFALIQAPQVGQQFDLVKLLDFWTSMMDIEASMEEFRAPPPQVGPDGQPIQPGAEGAAPGGTGIVPATNPQSLTAPIYG